MLGSGERDTALTSGGQTVTGTPKATQSPTSSTTSSSTTSNQSTTVEDKWGDQLLLTFNSVSSALDAGYNSHLFFSSYQISQ